MKKKIVLEGLCQFGNKCAHKHKRSSTSQCVYTDAVHHDVHKFKDEVDNLKNFIQSFLHMREEADELKKSIEDLKKELNLLAATNVAIQEQINYLDEDSNEESTGVDDRVSYKEKNVVHVSLLVIRRFH